jgi:hypothetical protein
MGLEVITGVSEACVHATHGAIRLVDGATHVLVVLWHTFCQAHHAARINLGAVVAAAAAAAG